MAARELIKHAVYPHPPELVWAALTDGQALAQWLMPNTFRAELGARIQFRVDPTGPIGGVVDCEVLELDPPRRMVWSWTIPRLPRRPGPLITRIEWTLTPEPAGTRLTLRQEGIDKLPLIFRLMMAFGWGTMLKRWLPRVVAAFEKTPQGLRYRRLDPAPNRGHHRTKTVGPEFFK